MFCHVIQFNTRYVCSAKLTGESATRGMGEEGTIGEAATGATATAGNGEDEETRIRANATRKRETIAR